MVSTHNWGKTVAFWQALGYTIDFETDHNSGQLSHPAGGPWLFVAEVPADAEPELQPIVLVDDAEQFAPPSAGSVDRPFVDQHWDVKEMVLLDPDGRRLSIQAPLSKSAPSKP
jgi:hypothetical protein